MQKAYRMLEEEGLIASHGGAKSVMVLDEGKAALVRGELLQSDAQSYMAAMRRMGVNKAEALALLEKLWE